MTEAHPEMTSDMLSGTSLYYSCIGYVLANFSKDVLSGNRTTHVPATATITSFDPYEPMSTTATGRYFGGSVLKPLCQLTSSPWTFSSAVR